MLAHANLDLVFHTYFISYNAEASCGWKLIGLHTLPLNHLAEILPTHAFRLGIKQLFYPTAPPVRLRVLA